MRQSRVNPDHKREGHPRVHGIFLNSYGFSAGFVNASFGDSSPNSSICTTNITRVLGFGKAFWDQVSDPTEDNLYKAPISVENVLASAHPITFSCYHSVGEFGVTGDVYVSTLKSAQKIGFNVVEKAALIYDTIFFLTLHHEKAVNLGEMNDDEQADWWFKLGIYYGTCIFLIFYTEAEVDPEN